MGSVNSLYDDPEIPLNFEYTYYKRHGKVFWKTTKINISFKDFTDLGFGYGKTNKKVYYMGEELKYSDPKHFFVNECGYGQDDKYTYKNGLKSKDKCDLTKVNQVRNIIQKEHPTRYTIDKKNNIVSWGYNMVLTNVKHSQFFVDLGGGYGKDMLFGKRGAIYFHNKHLKDVNVLLFEYNHKDDIGEDKENNTKYKKGIKIKN
jgi:hypothetical protein